MDFFGINGWEFLVLALLAMFIFGPDKLPKAISDGVRMLRNLRDMARNATTDLSRELGTEISLEDLNPKALIRKHILSEEDERAIRQDDHIEDQVADRADRQRLHPGIITPPCRTQTKTWLSPRRRLVRSMPASRLSRSMI